MIEKVVKDFKLEKVIKLVKYKHEIRKTEEI